MCKGDLSVTETQTHLSGEEPHSSTSTSLKENFARRGGKWLSQDELEAHLATVIRLENIGVLMGAGCSINSGGKTMNGLWDSFCAEYPESLVTLQTEGFVDSTIKSTNVEALLDSLEITLMEWHRVSRPKKIMQLTKARNDLRRSVIKAALLSKKWWQDACTVCDGSQLQTHRSLLQRLTASRQPGQCAPWFFTTNYDLALEWAAESMGLRVMNGFEGIHHRVFSPHAFDLGLSNMLARGEARFGTYGIYVAKLHGSLTWRMSEDCLDCFEVPSRQAWEEMQPFLNGQTEDSVKCPMVFPSAAKYAQTVGFVMGELFRRFTEFLSRPQTCLLVMGYSFSDEHLNLVLSRALQNPTLQLVICIPELIRDGNGFRYCRGTNRWVEKIYSLHSPQVTIIGDGMTAYFQNVLEYLPDPVIYDEYAQKMKKLLRELKDEKKGTLGDML